MTEDDQKQRLAQLEDRLKAAKRAQEPTARADADFSGGELAWRMVTEMVAGLGIGFGIGYGLDVLFGTMPIMLVLFTFLGFAAGVKTMMRTAQEIQDRQVAEQAEDDEQRG